MDNDLVQYLLTGSNWSHSPTYGTFVIPYVTRFILPTFVDVYRNTVKPGYNDIEGTVYMDVISDCYCI